MFLPSSAGPGIALAITCLRQGVTRFATPTHAANSGLPVMPVWTWHINDRRKTSRTTQF